MRKKSKDARNGVVMNNKTITTAEIRAALNKRLKELREIDLERRKKEFDRLPLEQRRVREAIGWSPYQSGQVINR